MDDIVETFLLEKLGEEIEGARNDAEKWGCKSRCNKLILIHKDCEDLMDLMQKTKSRTDAAVKETRREKLYYILNLIAEWRELSKKQPMALLSLEEIPRKLKQVKKELEDAHEGHPEQPPPKDPEVGIPRKLKQNKKELEDAHEGHTEQPPPKHPEVYRWSCHSVALDEIHGFDDKLKIMERMLLDDGSKEIWIGGVAGVGKTALCQKAYNLKLVKEHFPLRIWLCLSKRQKMVQLSFEDPFKRMLSCLGFEDQVIHNFSVEKLKLALRRQLNRGRYLIVLDDVQTVKEGDNVMVEKEIKDLFSFLTDRDLSRYEGTLLVTSRSPVSAKNTHRLLRLADDESCWEIFSDAYKEDDENGPPEELVKLKRDILDKCDGLPLMAKMLGKIGRGEREKPKTIQET